MSLSNRFASAAKSLFPETLKRELRRSLPIPDTEACLSRMQRNGFEVKLVIDVGAYVGDWTRMCRRVFPAASILMIEPPESALRRRLTAMIDMTTLDALTPDTAFAIPDLLKPDVQGSELEILKRAQRTLASAGAVLMEVNFIDIIRELSLFHEVVQFLAEHAFRPYDIGTFFRRAYDVALWQADVVFVTFSSRLVSSKRWN